MTYILRLYDALLEQGYEEFAGPRAPLWAWIKHYQMSERGRRRSLVCAVLRGSRHAHQSNRLGAVESRALPAREKGICSILTGAPIAAALIEFVRRNFTHREFGILVCHEQDEDKQAWGGINSTYGAVLALYAQATESAALGARRLGSAEFHAVFD